MDERLKEFMEFIAQQTHLEMRAEGKCINLYQEGILLGTFNFNTREIILRDCLAIDMDSGIVRFIAEPSQEDLAFWETLREVIREQIGLVEEFGQYFVKAANAYKN